MKKCTIANCNNDRVLTLKQNGGKNQLTHCCEKHAPSWATGGAPSKIQLMAVARGIKIGSGQKVIWRAK